MGNVEVDAIASHSASTVPVIMMYFERYIQFCYLYWISNSWTLSPKCHPEKASHAHPLCGPVTLTSDLLDLKLTAISQCFGHHLPNLVIPVYGVGRQTASQSDRQTDRRVYLFLAGPRGVSIESSIPINTLDDFIFRLNEFNFIFMPSP